MFVLIGFDLIIQGAVESVSVGEIRLSLRQSLVKLGIGFISRDPKLQVLICDLEVVLRSSTKGAPKARSRKSRSSGTSGTSGRGKWMVVANMARFLSVSVTELVLKVIKGKVFMSGWISATLCFSLMPSLFSLHINHSIHVFSGLSGKV